MVDIMRYKDLKDRDFEYYRNGEKHSHKEYYEKIIQQKIPPEDSDLEKFKIKLDLEFIPGVKYSHDEKDMLFFLLSDIIAEYFACSNVLSWEIKDIEVNLIEGEEDRELKDPVLKELQKMYKEDAMLTGEDTKKLDKVYKELDRAITDINMEELEK